MSETQQTPPSDREVVERTGRAEAVTGQEPASFKSEDKIPKAHDFTGPAGDPAEGKRS